MNAGMDRASRPPSVDLGPRASYGGIVTSLPLQATYEMTLVAPSSHLIASGAIYRDSAGRVRRECHIRENAALESVDWVVVTDLAAHNAVVLNAADQTAISIKDFGPPQGRSALTTGWGYHGCWSSDAGEEMNIEGELCRKVARIGGPFGAELKNGETGEIWISDEIKYSVFERVTDPEQEYTWRLYDIQRKEPPESIFGIPAGYAVVSK
jgi:hypothetical protein